jgi:hypothetical protein
MRRNPVQKAVTSELTHSSQELDFDAWARRIVDVASHEPA